MGGGFAGLTAAMWLGRYRRSTLLINSGTPRNNTSHALHGYPGFDGADPELLLKKLQNEVSRYAVDHLRAVVERVEGKNDDFTVHTPEATYNCRRILIATGTEDERPDIPDFKEYDGQSAWHCPACDGYEYKDKRLGVIAWGPHMAGYALELLPYTKDLTLLTNGKTPEASRGHIETLTANNISINTKKITKLASKNGLLTAVTFEDGTTLDMDGLFYSIRHHPQLQFFNQLACKLGEECVEVDDKQETSTEGVYAAGDLMPSIDIVIVAAATGAVAATSIHRSLIHPSQQL